MTTNTQKRKTKNMADAGPQRFTKSVFHTPPLTAKSSENFHYQLFWCCLVLINVEMLVMTKNMFDSVYYPNSGPKMNFLSALRTLVIDGL